MDTRVYIHACVYMSFPIISLKLEPWDRASAVNYSWNLVGKKKNLESITPSSVRVPSLGPSPSPYKGGTTFCCSNSQSCYKDPARCMGKTGKDAMVAATRVVGRWAKAVSKPSSSSQLEDTLVTGKAPLFTLFRFLISSVRMRRRARWI